MDERGAFAAALLDASLKGLAALVTARARRSGADAAARALLAAPDAVADAEQRLQHLAESVAAGLPELFAAHVEWSLATCRARGISAGFVPAVLAALADVLERELPAEAWPLLRPHVEAGLQVLARPARSAPSLFEETAGAGATGRLGEVARAFLLALLEGRRADAVRTIEQALGEGIAVGELHGRVVGAALSEVGRMWQTGEVHVGEERLSSVIVADALALLRHRAERRAPHGGRVLVASVEGNLHDLGAQIVADRLELEGWTQFFLGANVPTEDLLRSAVDHHVDVLALSAGLGVHVRAAARVVAGAHALTPKRLPVVVGGQIFNRVPELGRAVGADACAAGPEEAAAACARLAGR